MKKDLCNSATWKKEDVTLLDINSPPEMLRARETYQMFTVVGLLIIIILYYTILLISISFCNESVTLNVRTRIFIYFFLERGREGEREREKYRCVVASHMPPLGTWPTTQAYALTKSQTSNPLVCSPHSNHWAMPPRARTRIFKNITLENIT